jgi:hypothetical protein
MIVRPTLAEAGAQLRCAPLAGAELRCYHLVNWAPAFAGVG